MDYRWFRQKCPKCQKLYEVPGVPVAVSGSTKTVKVKCPYCSDAGESVKAPASLSCSSPIEAKKVN